jgi:hypothetical protein
MKKLKPIIKLHVTVLNKIVSLQIDTSWQDHDL